jgi:hypothetical protein
MLLDGAPFARGTLSASWRRRGLRVRAMGWNEDEECDDSGAHKET